MPVTAQVGSLDNGACVLLPRRCPKESQDIDALTYPDAPVLVTGSSVLVTTAHPSQGFTALWKGRRLALTVQAHVLAPHYTPCSLTLNVRRPVHASPSTAMPRVGLTSHQQDARSNAAWGSPRQPV